MAIFNLADYMQLAVENSTPQLNRSRWTIEEDVIIHKCISNAVSLTDISKIISLRTSPAIRTRANKLGYGFYRSKTDDLTYFRNKINHKYRRTNNEIFEGTEKIPIESAKAVEDCDEKSTAIIAEKQMIEIAVSDLNEIRQTLSSVLVHFSAIMPNSVPVSDVGLSAVGGDL